MHHGEEVLHALHVASRLKEKSHAREYCSQAQFIEVAPFPAGSMRNGIRIILGNAQEFPDCIIANELMKLAVPEHNRCIAKPVVEIIPPHLAVPQRVIAKGDKRY